MELELLVVVNSGTSTEPDVRWWYFCSAGEEEQLESTTVMYMKTYMLECTQPILVSFLSMCTLNSNIVYLLVILKEDSKATQKPCPCV